MPLDKQHKLLLDDIIESLHNERLSPGIAFKIMKLGLDLEVAINELEIIFGNQELLKGLRACQNIIK